MLLGCGPVTRSSTWGAEPESSHEARADVEWRSGVAEQLPVPSTFVDRTISQFAAMFFVDRSRAVDEMVRVTRPGGRVALTTWASVDRSPGYAGLVELLDEHVGGWAVEAPMAPFSLGTEERVRTAFGSGHPFTTITTEPGTARFGSIDEWLHTDIRGWTLADGVDEETDQELLRAARVRLAKFAADDGTVAFDAPAIIGVIEV
jgi:SAM-dependent methyltransferase